MAQWQVYGWKTFDEVGEVDPYWYDVDAYDAALLQIVGHDVRLF